MTRTYLALTTTNPLGGYRCIGIGDTRDEAYEMARAALARQDALTGIYGQTERRNLVVVSQATAYMRYGYDLDQGEYDA